MSNENPKESEPNHSAFVPNLLKCFRFIEAKRMSEVLAFFSQAYLTHAADSEFDDPDYRIEWQNNINYIADINKNIKDFSEEDIEVAIEVALIKLKLPSKESEVSNG